MLKEIDRRIFPTAVKGQNHVFGGEGILRLPVRVGKQAGQSVMTTAWRLTEDQIALLIQSGGIVEITLMGDTHPPIAVQVGE